MSVEKRVTTEADSIRKCLSPGTRIRLCTEPTGLIIPIPIILYHKLSLIYCNYYVMQDCRLSRVVLVHMMLNLIHGAAYSQSTDFDRPCFSYSDQLEICPSSTYNSTGGLTSRREKRNGKPTVAFLPYFFNLFSFTVLRVRNEKIDINKINWTPNQHKEYHNLYIKTAKQVATDP